MKTYLALFLGLVLVAIGSLFGYQQVLAYTAHPTSAQVSDAMSVAPAPKMAIPTEMISGKPNRIVVSSVGIDVPVIDGIYNTKSQTWTLSEDNAHYALITPLANNREGNTFIYAHNRPQLFSKLLDAKAGAKAVVYTTNGHKFTYQLRSERATKPTDDSLFHYKGAPILTLQTCSGAWFQNRSLFTFDLVGVE